MITKYFRNYLSKIERSEYILLNGSRLIRTENGKSLYKTKNGYLFWLDKSKDLDKNIIDTGYFEKESTQMACQLINVGDVVLDIGANIGYYTVIFSNLVGDTGSVYAFEPTKNYSQFLDKNLAINKVKNVKTFNFGFSDEVEIVKIYINNSSATIHPTTESTNKVESINLTTIDNFVTKEKLKKIDFIKIDVDGHEPAILKGGLKTIKRFRPKILLEVSHLHYLKYGINAWDFYNFLVKNNFEITDVLSGERIADQNDFLIRCGNFCQSSNILLELK